MRLPMNEFDGRKINCNTLEEIRIRAVKRVEDGEKWPRKIEPAIKWKICYQ